MLGRGLRSRVLFALAAVALAALSSCSSLFHTAMDSMVEREEDRALAKADAGESAGSPPQTAPRNVDRSMHKIAGAWVNPDYNSEGRAARVVYSPNEDGTYTYVAFDRLDGGEVYEGTATYLRTWIDEAGRSCGESTVTLNNGMSWRMLDRISADGNTLEVQSGVEKIDPKGLRYSIYYRP
jgi:hypothetical protein